MALKSILVLAFGCTRARLGANRSASVVALVDLSNPMYEYAW
jgi:hypothetical protein